MEVTRDGNFMLTITSEALSRGLRPSVSMPRDKEYLIECVGAVGIDNVLQVIEDLEANRIDITAMGAQTFPYPQIFLLPDLIILCDATNIYELVSGTPTLRLGPVATGGLWSVISVGNYVYMSNSSVAVVRDPFSQIFAITANLPAFSSIVNFNGQLMIGAPDEPWV